jgi:hypothetical protein
VAVLFLAFLQDPTTVDTIIYKRLDETYNINPADYDGAFEEPEVSIAGHDSSVVKCCSPA